ncbi:MAG: DUF3306 domain-containing protein, partial [Beijerinckiaceae bacterium]|nr:DUF3306 domain-containing protein [Beijerinckiaceae bacterium]
MSSRDDEMDKGEGFLGRWIKRKAQAREIPEAESSDVELGSGAPDPSTQADDDRPAAETDPKAAEPVFDLASLPSIE